MLFNVKTAMTAVFLFMGSHAFAASDDDCGNLLDTVQTAYFSSKAQFTMAVSDAGSFSPYLLLHLNNGQGSYTLWETLNSEIEGYALKDQENLGFDYNRDRNLFAPLSWHDSSVWDQILGKRGQIKGYSCVLTGRTRMAGRPTSLLRLVPQDGLRYSYVIAADDHNHMPIALTALSPEGKLVSRIMALDLRFIDKMDFPISDEDFLRYSAKPKASAAGKAWPELNIPAVFQLKEEGKCADQEQCLFQTFSDGLVSFRVYRNQRSSVYFPAMNNGLITVLRKDDGRHEYAVAGAIPLRLADFVLSRIGIR